MKTIIATGVMCAMLGSTLICSAARAKSAEDFIQDAIKGDNSEIKLGSLAQDKGSSESVRNFGKTLVADHTKAKGEAEKTAHALNVTPPTDVMPEAQQEYDKLNGMSGKAFDDEFARYMTEDHNKDISDFKEEASAKDGKASTLASEQLPTLEKHLKIAESLKSAHS